MSHWAIGLQIRLWSPGEGRSECETRRTDFFLNKSVEARGERRHSPYSFMTSALMSVSGQIHASAALYPLKKDPQYPLDRRLGPRAGLDTEATGKIFSLCLAGIEP
jgi:hypothetical protein